LIEDLTDLLPPCELLLNPWFGFVCFTAVVIMDSTAEQQMSYGDVESLERRLAAAEAVLKARLRHDAVFADAKSRILTPRQEYELAANERRIAKPYVDRMEELEASQRRDEHLAKARITLLSRLKKV
jgi:hypothetical protein